MRKTIITLSILFSGIAMAEYNPFGEYTRSSSGIGNAYKPDPCGEIEKIYKDINNRISLAEKWKKRSLTDSEKDMVEIMYISDDNLFSISKDFLIGDASSLEKLIETRERCGKTK